MSEILISCIIPCSQNDLKSQKLQDLIDSIHAQDFPQDQIEILTITEGDSESAKAKGIRQAKGYICAMFCADNMIMEKTLFKRVYSLIKSGCSGVYPWNYAYVSSDNSLNRYFSLIGGNDPISYYLGKNDRVPHVISLMRQSNYQPSYGCNGFFYKSSEIKKTNLDNYYPMDNAMEIEGTIQPISSEAIWHRTSDNLFTFLKKRYKYAKDLYCDRGNRRWKMVHTKEDILRLGLFILFVLTVAEPLYVSIKGFQGKKDWAWFWHWPVCVGFLITYTALSIRNMIKHGNPFQVRCQLQAS